MPSELGPQTTMPWRSAIRAKLDVARAGRLVALLGEAGADDDRGADAAPAALLDRLDDMRRRHQDHGEIGRLRQCGDRRDRP